MSSNGAIPLSELTAVGGGFYLQHNAAAAYIALRTACLAATGVQLVISAGDGAYRTLAEQQRELDIWNGKGTRPANPGGSNHGWGTAVDIYNYAAAGGWLPANAARFNFTRPFADEGWHFQYVGTITAGTGTTELPNKRKQASDMYIKGKSGADVYVVWTDANGHARLRPCVGEEGNYAKLGGLVVEASDESLTNVATACGYYDKLPLPQVAVTIDAATAKKIGQAVILPPQPDLLIAGTARPVQVKK